MEKHPHARGEDDYAETAKQYKAGNTPTHVGKTYFQEQRRFFFWKHPHARGEDKFFCRPARIFRETPPRTWGRPPGSWSRSPRNGKHPHARGEDRLACLDVTDAEETPPRTWGRRKHVSHGNLLTGNTPTHVGKTQSEPFHRSKVWKHPHARGEDSVKEVIPTIAPETPPRTWGRQERAPDIFLSVRNTPTHVGKTVDGAEVLPLFEKHPHARGEDFQAALKRDGKEETPPRTWGRLHRPEPRENALRNTPTHVGKTCQKPLGTS